MSQNFESSHHHSTGHHHDGSHHHDHIGKVEHRILDHLAHHHSASEIHKELQHLRDYEQKHGGNIHNDIKELNRRLHADTVKAHLPSLSIVDHGNKFELKTGADAKAFLERSFHQLPAAVQHDIRSHYHHGHHSRHHGGQFVPPSEARDKKGETPQAADQHSDDPSTGKHDMPATDASPSKNGFGTNLLERLHLPVTPANLAFLDAWQKAEGGSIDNPFNTTQSMPGAHNFNGVGVKRYASMQDGLDATVKTLTNGYYGHILKALGQSDTHKAAVALAHSAWGTHNILNFV